VISVIIEYELKIVQFQIQFPLICLSHGLQDVILSPNELSGKYVKFNRLIDFSGSKVPWEDPLKESAKIALSSPSVK
jgi:hypothetical protein